MGCQYQYQCGGQFAGQQGYQNKGARCGVAFIIVLFILLAVICSGFDNNGCGCEEEVDECDCGCGCEW